MMCEIFRIVEYGALYNIIYHSPLFFRFFYASIKREAIVHWLLTQRTLLGKYSVEWRVLTLPYLFQMIKLLFSTLTETSIKIIDNTVFKIELPKEY